MSEDILSLNDIHTWLQSRGDELVQGVTLAGVRRSAKHTASAFADFDAANTLGRIIVWVSGEIDFEVIRREDGGFAFFNHQVVSHMSDPRLQHIYREFLEQMVRPDEPRHQ